VSGSVSITKAKKKKAEFFNVIKRVFRIFDESEPLKNASKAMLSRADMKKLTNNSMWRIFLIINSPPKITIGSIDGVPTHQLAEKFIVKDTRTTAIATGLKICFLLIANIYFEATPQILAQNASGKNCEYTPPSIGVIIKNNIRAVMYIDSTFVGALYT